MSDQCTNIIPSKKTAPSTSSRSRSADRELFDEPLIDNNYVNLVIRDDTCVATSTPAKRCRQRHEVNEPQLHQNVPLTGATDEVQILPSHPHHDTDLPREPITPDTQMITYTNTEDIPKLDYFLRSMNITMIPSYLQDKPYNDLDEDTLETRSAKLLKHCGNVFHDIIGIYTNPGGENRPTASETKFFLSEIILEIEEKYFVFPSPLRMREINRNLCQWLIRDPKSYYKYYEEWLISLENYLNMDFDRINTTSNEEGHRQCNIILIIFIIIVNVFQHDLPLFLLFDFINDLNYDYSNIYAIPIQHRLNLEKKLIKFYYQSRSNIQKLYSKKSGGEYDWRDNVVITEVKDEWWMQTGNLNEQLWMNYDWQHKRVNIHPISRRTRASQATYNRLFRGSSKNMRYFR